MSDFQQWLHGKIEAVNQVEMLARDVLDGRAKGNYAILMRQKADILAGLANEGDSLLQSLSAEKRRLAKDTLRRFSASAETALSLNSVWFMSALLYPEDHKPGQPHDLQVFFDSLK